mgnify:FL=1
MFRSIQAECFKVVHRPYFWITTILCALFSVGVIFCLYLIKTEAGGVNPVNMPFAVASLLFGLPAGIYLVVLGVDMVFSEQYKYNTLKNEVSFGVGRFRIYASRWVVSLLILAVLYLVLVFAYALASLILLGLPSQADAQAMYGVDVGRSVLNAFRALRFYTLAAFPLWLGGMSLAIACHFLITSSTVAAFSYIGILMVLSMALDNLGQYVNPMFTSLYHLTLNYHMDHLLVGDLPWSKIGQCWLIGLGWTAVSTALGAALFARKEIK